MKNKIKASKIITLLAFYIFINFPLFSQSFIGSEYFIDTDPGTGNGQALSTSSTVAQSISTTGISTGPHTLYVRTQNADGTWNRTKSKTFYVSDANPQSNNFTSGEYYINSDNGTGSNTAFSDLTTVQNIAVNEPGFHTLYLRLQDDNNNWTKTKSKSFYVAQENQQQTSFVTGEYYIDSDNGSGNNSSITDINSGQNIAVNEVGHHTLYLRLQDNNNNWTMAKSKSFYVQESSEGAEISGLEYYIDSDPGIGNGEFTELDEPATSIRELLDVNTNGYLADGHTISFRLLTENGNWSQVVTKSFELVDCTLPDMATTPKGYDILCASGEPQSYTVDDINNAESYEWKLEPVDAATFITSSTTAEMDWRDSFTGNAYILVRGNNACGPGKWSDTLIVEASENFPCPGDVFYSITNGNWQSITTWSDSEDGQATQVIPGKYNEIRIKGNQILVNSNTTSGDIYIEADTENKTSLKVENNALLEVYGRVKMEKAEGNGTTSIETTEGGQIECKE